MPAYFVLIVVVSAFSYVLLPPRELNNFGESLSAQSVYLQNVAFWIQGEYFDKAHTKPLLHTWSLAVEEQFYLIFALSLVAIRRRLGLALGLFITVCVFSYACGYLISMSSPKTSFYLLPPRIWEFGAGLCAALIFRSFRNIRVPLILAEAVYVVSIFLVLFSIFAFDEESIFPGAQAIIAVGGSAMICLLQCHVGERTAKFLTTSLAQHFGKISYSWYLWHWPVTVFFAMHFSRMPRFYEALACLLLGYALGLLSYRLIEQRGLAATALRQPRYAVGLLSCFAIFSAALGTSIVESQGALHRYPLALRNHYAASMDDVPYRCSYIARMRYHDAEVCKLNNAVGPRSVLLIGDSHADRAKSIIADLGTAAGVPVYLTKRNCKIIDFGKTRNCTELVWKHILKDMERYHTTRVIAISHWPKETTTEEFQSGARRVLAAGAELFLQKVAPRGDYFNPVLPQRIEAIKTGSTVPIATYTTADYDRDNIVQNASFRQLATDYPRVHILDPVPLLCQYRGSCDFFTNGEPNYLDNNHLNSVGMSRVDSMYRAIFSAPPNNMASHQR